MQLPLLKSLVLILRNYASLWLRLKFSKPLDLEDELRHFVEEYLAILPDQLGDEVIIYHEDLRAAEGTLPQDLLTLWDIWDLQHDDASRAARIGELRKIAQSCNESDESCESAACRPLPDVFGVYHSISVSLSIFPSCAVSLLVLRFCEA